MEQNIQAGCITALPPPKFLPRRYKPKNVGEWTGHLTFASELIAALQPHLVVELGTHWGEAYFTFCQTVQEQGLNTVCYAVDHWLGDEHAGLYGEEVFEEVSRYNDRFYRQFSYLLRRSFDEALAEFGDESIDLLHIDGLHTYEAVTHDFRSWLPKVKPGGIVLLHDTCPRHQDFGVWRLWRELRAEFPDAFEFHHSWGLGVIRKPGEANRALLTDLLFDRSPARQEEIRRHYVTYASHLERLFGQTPIPALPAELITNIRVEVFPGINGQHSAEVCQIRTMKSGTWNTLAFDFRYEGIGAPLRIDPGYQPGIIELGEVKIFSAETGELIWSLPAGEWRDQVQLGGSAVPCPDGGPLIISLGDDPQLLLMLPSGVHGPMKLSVSLKVQPASKWVVEALYDRLHAQADQTEKQIRAAEEERRTVAAQLDAVTAELARTNEARNRSEAALQQTRSWLSARETTITEIKSSLSWRVTAPLRQLMTTIRSGPRKRT